MDQFEIEHFNRATTITVRINNLIANARLSKVTTDADEAQLVFSTMKKLKPTITMTYVIPSELLTDLQFSYLINLASRQK
jgi:hypothetical protein